MLPELQRDFGAALRDDGAPVPAEIVGGRIPAGARLQVYRNNHRQSLRRALADCFPVLSRLVGEGFFAWMAHRYTAMHPPRAGNLHHFGAALPGFLADFEGTAAHPWLVDVARLEWAMQESYHAAEHAPMNVAALAAVPSERQEHLRMRLHPAARLLASRWPLLRILEVNQADGGGERVDLDAGGDRVLVTRPAQDVLSARLDAGPYALLHALAAGAVFGEACERALEAQPALDLGACMQTLIGSYVLVAFETGD